MTPLPTAADPTVLAKQTANKGRAALPRQDSRGRRSVTAAAGARAQRPLCGEERSGRAGPTSELWTVQPCALHPLRLPGTPALTCLPRAGSRAPTPHSGAVRLSVRALVGLCARAPLADWLLPQAWPSQGDL